MISWIFRKIYALFGWKFVLNTELPKKFVVIGAPHTSLWDGILAMGATFVWGLRMRFFAKKELFVFPMSLLYKAFGCIPVDRSKHNSLTDQIVEEFNRRDKFILGVTPEGTRSYVTKWKKGFYYIALKAKVPIAIGFIDAEKKIGGIDHLFYPTGDYDKDIKEIMAFYYDKKGINPELGVFPPGHKPQAAKVS